MNIRNILIAIAAFAFSLWLSINITGCATDRLQLETGTRISKDKIAQIHKGVSTKEEIKALFGKPLDTLVFGKGEAWFYKDINIIPLYIEFNHNGIVTDYKTK